MKLAVVTRRQHAKTGRSGWQGPDSYIAVTSRDPHHPLYSSGRNVWWWYFGEGYLKNQGPKSSLGRATAEANEFVERFSSATSAEEIVHVLKEES